MRPCSGAGGLADAQFSLHGPWLPRSTPSLPRGWKERKGKGRLSGLSCKGPASTQSENARGGARGGSDAPWFSCSQVSGLSFICSFHFPWAPTTRRQPGKIWGCTVPLKSDQSHRRHLRFPSGLVKKVKRND